MLRLVTLGWLLYLCLARTGMHADEQLSAERRITLHQKSCRRISKVMITPLIFGVWELSCKPHFSQLWDFIDNCSFAMLTGKPPFQSATADEIYRRAREREYDWPKLNMSENFISQETKDLVSELLQPAEKRPDPDTIV